MAEQLNRPDLSRKLAKHRDCGSNWPVRTRLRQIFYERALYLRPKVSFLWRFAYLISSLNTKAPAKNRTGSSNNNTCIKLFPAVFICGEDIVCVIISISALGRVNRLRVNIWTNPEQNISCVNEAHYYRGGNIRRVEEGWMWEGAKSTSSWPQRRACESV